MIKKYNIVVNGKSYEVEVEELKTETSKASNEKTIQKTAPKPNVKAQNTQSPVGGGSINAPMPGTINDVYVHIDENVKKGQVLLILEAMKMENEIMANSDGIVKSINVSKGSLVDVGDNLVTIE